MFGIFSAIHVYLSKGKIPFKYRYFCFKNQFLPFLFIYTCVVA